MVNGMKSQRFPITNGFRHIKKKQDVILVYAMTILKKNILSQKKETGSSLPFIIKNKKSQWS